MMKKKSLNLAPGNKIEEKSYKKREKDKVIHYNFFLINVTYN